MLHAIHLSNYDQEIESVVLIEADDMCAALDAVADRLIKEYAELNDEETTVYDKVKERWDGHPHPMLTIAIKTAEMDKPYKLDRLTACVLDDWRV